MKPATFNRFIHCNPLRQSALPVYFVQSGYDLLPLTRSTFSITSKSSVSASPVRQYGSEASRVGASATDRAESIARSRAALDDVLRMRGDEQRRAYHIRRAKFSAAGMLVSMAIPLLIVMNLNIDELAKQDTDKEEKGTTKSIVGPDTAASSLEQPKQQHQASIPFISPERADSGAGDGSGFDGKPVIMQRGMSKSIAHDTITGEDTELVPTNNSTVPYFPRTITLPTSSSSTSASTSILPSTLSSTVTTTPLSKSTKSEPYVLLGLGIRTVSFLSIQVYVVGLYVPQSDLPNLQHTLTKYINPLASALIPDEKVKLKQSLVDPSSSEEIWSTVLHGFTSDTSSSSSSSSSSSNTTPIRAALRIVPVRNTDFAHLRDGWVRGITSRTQAAARRGSHEFDDDNFGMAMRGFKALFGGKGRAPKGSVMVLVRDATGKLEVLMKEEENERTDKVGRDTTISGPKIDSTSANSSNSSNSSSVSSSSSLSTEAERYISLGTVTDERISRLIVMGYLAGKDVSSEGARQNIVKGVMGLVERPAGTIETKVE